MSTKSIVALLIIFVVMCTVYIGIGVFREEEKVQEQQSSRLFEFDPSAVVQLTITSGDNAPVTGKRSANGGWTITAPFGIQANPYVWNRVAIALAQLINTYTVQSEVTDAGRFGLDQPTAEVMATLDDGKQVHVAVGAKEPTGEYYYARVDDGPVILVTKEAGFEMNRDLDVLRHAFMFSVPQEDTVNWIQMARVRMADDGTLEESLPVEMALKDDGLWHVVRPVDAPADHDRVDTLALLLRSARGFRFVDNPESLADYGLQPPHWRLSIKTEDNPKEQTVYFGDTSTLKEDGDVVYVQRKNENTVFLVDSRLINVFPENPEAYVDTHLLTRQLGDMTRIEYTEGLTRIRLEQDPKTGWHMTLPAVDDTDPFEVSGFITMLKGATLIEMVGAPEPQYGLESPTRSVIIYFASDRPPLAIHFGLPTTGDAPKGVYVTQDTGVVGILKHDMVRALKRTPFDFRKKELLPFDPVEAKSVTMRFDGEDYLFETVDGRWVVRTPVGGHWGVPSDMDALLEALSDIRASGVQMENQPTDLGPFGLMKPLLQVSVVTEALGGKGPKTWGPLRIGSPTEDDGQRRYAVLEGRYELFRVRQSDIDTLRDVMAAFQR